MTAPLRLRSQNKVKGYAMSACSDHCYKLLFCSITVCLQVYNACCILVRLCFWPSCHFSSLCSIYLLWTISLFTSVVIVSQSAFPTHLHLFPVVILPRCPLISLSPFTVYSSSAPHSNPPLCFMSCQVCLSSSIFYNSSAMLALCFIMCLLLIHFPVLIQAF